MKKRILRNAVLASFFVALLSQQVMAADISLGGSVLFNWWNPAWNNRKYIMYSPDLIKFPVTDAPRYSIIQSYLYGPDLTVRFLRAWEISASFRYGTGKTDADGLSLFPATGKQRFMIAFDLYDIYARAGYYVFGFLMPFAGLRIEVIESKTDYDMISMLPPIQVSHANLKGETLKFTPELGMHFAVPIASFLTLTVDVTGTFQSGTDRFNYENMYYGWRPTFNFPSIPAGRYYAVGCSPSAALIINIPKIDTSLTMGGYYRLLGYFQKTKDRSLFIMNRSLDHTYGLSCSVAYSFSTTRGQARDLWIPRPEYPMH